MRRVMLSDGIREATAERAFLEQNAQTLRRGQTKIGYRPCLFSVRWIKSGLSTGPRVRVPGMMSAVLLAWALAHGVTQQWGPLFLLLLHWKGLS